MSGRPQEGLDFFGSGGWELVAMQRLYDYTMPSGGQYWIEHFHVFKRPIP